MVAEVDIVARTLFGEARGEMRQGQQAVANVIMNRAKIGYAHPHFGDGTPSTACLAHMQFSCWNENDPNRAIILDVDDSNPIFSQCLQIATEAVAGSLEDITDNATYYYVKGSPEPAWAVDKEPCAIIGRHLFYKDIA